MPYKDLLLDHNASEMWPLTPVNMLDVKNGFSRVLIVERVKLFQFYDHSLSVLFMVGAPVLD